MRKIWFIKIPVIILLFLTLISALVMTLWNWLMPEIFGLPEVTFWQAAGLFVLSRIIFGLGRGGKPGHHHHQGPPWKRWKDRWQAMPEESRERWKQRFADKWCREEEKVDTQEPRSGREEPAP